MCLIYILKYNLFRIKNLKSYIIAIRFNKEQLKYSIIITSFSVNIPIIKMIINRRVYNIINRF